jgi:hypothetical protein
VSALCQEALAVGSALDGLPSSKLLPFEPNIHDLMILMSSRPTRSKTRINRFFQRSEKNWVASGTVRAIRKGSNVIGPSLSDAYVVIVFPGIYRHKVDQRHKEIRTSSKTAKS